jgi:hypothetical protein
LLQSPGTVVSNPDTGRIPAICYQAADQAGGHIAAAYKSQGSVIHDFDDTG